MKNKCKELFIEKDICYIRFKKKIVKGEIKESISIHEYLSQITQNVLLGSIKPKPGTKVENIIDSIIHKTLGA